MCSVKVCPGSEINVLDTHALLGTIYAEFKNARSKLLYAGIESVDVEDVAEDHDLQH